MIKINNIISKKDPITRRIIKNDFCIFRNGAILHYDANTLYSYIKSSGDLRDPISRTEFSTVELMRLDRISNSSFKVSKNIEKLKRQFKLEQERCGLRDHFLEELTNLFNEAFKSSLEGYDSFISFTATYFIINFTQITESIKVVCTIEEMNVHQDFLGTNFLRFFKEQGVMDLRVIRIFATFINYI